MARLKTKLLMAALAITATLGILEIVIRIGHLAPDMAVIAEGRFKLSKDPMIGYEMEPNYSYTGRQLRFYDYRDKSNSLGFRDRDHSVAKPPGIFRIMVLGDSVTQGLNLPDKPEDIFTSVLEHVLLDKGQHVEVLNFGVSGYNTQQEVYTLKDKGLAFTPDLVVLAYCLNDVEMVNGGIIRILHYRETQTKSLDETFLLPYLANSALYRFVYGRLAATRLPKELDERNKQLGENTVEPSFAVLRQLGEEHGFKTLVAVFPMRDQDEDEAHYQFPVRLSATNHFESIDLRDSFRQCAGGQPSINDLMFDGFHPNQRGHKCAGEALANVILDRHLTTPGAR